MADVPPTNLKLRYLMINFIGLALVVSVFVYAGVVEVMTRWLSPPYSGVAGFSPENARLLRYLFFFLAVGHYLVIKFLNSRLPRTPQALPQTAVITFALCEAVAIYGLMLFLLTGETLNFYIFFALSLFYFYSFYPRYDQWERLLGSEGGQSGQDSGRG